MKALKFLLKGKSAFFKKNDVNAYIYYTYGNIHKIALLGVLGSIIGLRGYKQQKKIEKYPEFYERLKDLKVSVITLNKEGYINKKVQTFNNSVGYASREEGGVLIVKEQWLEYPAWQIYILDDNSNDYQKIRDNILNAIYEFIPYLGKNEHYADILSASEIDLTINNDEGLKIDSLFLKNNFEYIVENNDDDNKIEYFKYQELLPLRLSEELNQYEKEYFVNTNRKVRCITDDTIYKAEGLNLYFF